MELLGKEGWGSLQGTAFGAFEGKSCRSKGGIDGKVAPLGVFFPGIVLPAVVRGLSSGSIVVAFLLVGVGRDLWVHLDQGHLQQGAHHHVLVAFGRSPGF